MNADAIAAHRTGSRVEAQFLQPCDVIEYADRTRHVVRSVTLLEGAAGKVRALIIHADGSDDRLMHPEVPVRLVLAP